MSDLNTNNDEKAKLKEELDDSAANEPDEIDPKAKFLNGGKTIDEAHVVVEVSSSEESFTGLGKEELMQYANDPFWKKVRLILFVLFWIGWIGMLVAAIVIIVLAPRCPYRPDLKWYEKETVYQVYPKSFKDSNEESGPGAGVGDLKGIISKLGYVKELGAKILYINSFYKSGGVDNGLDIIDHKEIDDFMGTMGDFDSLRKQTKADMRLILDFIPNHTGKNHTWFLSSQKKEGKYSDYYVWRNCTKNSLPNNWKTVHGKAAWTYDETRKECYFHQFLTDEPDLNLNNEDVKKELEEILRFWLGKGVDGFNIVGAEYLTEDTSFADEQPGSEGMYTRHQNGSLELIYHWRSVMDSYATKPGKERLLLVSVSGDANQTRMYYGNNVKNGANIVTVKVVESASASLPQDLLAEIEAASEDKHHRRGWMFGNQDSSRLATVVGKPKVHAMLALQMLLPGTPFNYYGDEIAMEDGVVTFSQTKDPIGKRAGFSGYQAVSRDPYRTPMLWTPKANAGFTEEKFVPWLPVSNAKVSNVESQKAAYTKHDEWRTFHELTALRTNESIQWGEVKAGLVDSDVLWFTRKADGFPGYLIVMNLGSTAITNKFYDTANIPADVKVVYHSHEELINSINLEKQAVNLDQNHVIVFQYSK